MSAATMTDHLALVGQVAEEMSRSLPADTGWTTIAEEAPLLPDNARAVVAMLAGEMRVGLAMSPTFARTLIVGPPPADSLEEALDPAFTAAAAMLSANFGIGGSLGELSESTAADVVASMGGSVFTVRFMDGDVHAATLVVASNKDLAAVVAADVPEFEQLPESAPVTDHRPVSMLADVSLGVTVELGRARLTVAEVLSLTIGSVVELDRVAGSPVDVLVNGTLIARGEVVVIDEEFGVRVSEVIGYQPSERLRR
jgi:flagellar motor switch protein FliN